MQVFLGTFDCGIPIFPYGASHRAHVQRVFLWETGGKGLSAKTLTVVIAEIAGFRVVFPFSFLLLISVN